MRFLLVVLTSILFLSLYVPVFAQNGTGEIQNTKDNTSDNFYNVIQTWATVIVIPVTVAAGFGVYAWSEQSQKNKAKSRSVVSMERELSEIKDGFTTDRHTRTTDNTKRPYTFGEGDAKITINKFDYVNAFFVTDAYEAMINSGFLTYFKADTQHDISELYGRIKLFNETGLYIRQFRDNFYMTPDVTEDDWNGAVERYRVTLTRYEEQIKKEIDKVLNIEEIKKIIPKK